MWLFYDEQSIKTRIALCGYCDFAEVIGNFIKAYGNLNS